MLFLAFDCGGFPGPHTLGHCLDTQKLMMARMTQRNHTGITTLSLLERLLKTDRWCTWLKRCIVTENTERNITHVSQKRYDETLVWTDRSLNWRHDGPLHSRGNTVARPSTRGNQSMTHEYFLSVICMLDVVCML